MSALLAIAGTVVQGLLMPLLALLLAGLERWFAARLAGAAAPSLLLPLRAIRGVFARQLVRREDASVLTAAGPVMAFAATWGAAFLVPVAGFGGDLLTVAGLLILARLLARGVEAGGAEDRAALVAEPALLLALLARGLPGGGAAGPIAAAALGVTVLALLGREEVVAEASGGDLALLRMAAALRRLVLFVLLAGQLVTGLREEIDGTLVGAAATALGAVLLAVGVAIGRAALGPMRPRRRHEALVACLVLAVLAVLVGLLEAAA